MPRRLPLMLFSLLFVLLGILAPPPARAGESLVIYSGRSKNLVAPLIRRFEQISEIDVQVRYGKTSQLAVALAEEGERSPADLFWAQDAGALGSVAGRGLFAPLPESITGSLPARYRGEGNRWVATSGRARVLAYAPERVDTENLPESVTALTGQRWRGRVGWAPPNGSFQAFVTAMRLEHGDEATLAWLKAMKANGARAYPSNTAIVQALAAGEVDLGLVNHYYLLRFKTSDKAYPVEQTHFAPGDIGNLVNVAGAGVLKHGKHPEAAHAFLRFLLGEQAQQYFTSYVFEYPVISGTIPHPALVEEAAFRELAPEVDLQGLSDLEGTLALLREAGLL